MLTGKPPTGRPTMLPWWHSKFVNVPRTVISSGCTSTNGNVLCDPEQMRAGAEKQMRNLGLWSKSEPLTLAHYTLGRNATSETGSGTPEQQMAVILAAINRAKMRFGGDVNKLLLYLGPNGGYYGAINNSSGGAPYGRWAATSRDPTAMSLLLADFALKGGADGFTRGGDDQAAMRIYSAARIQTKAQTRDYWVGHLPGVDPTEVLVFANYPDVDPSSALGQRLIQDGITAVSNPSQAALVARTQFDDPYRASFLAGSVPGPVVVAVAGALGLGLTYAVAARFEDRGKVI